MMSQGLFLKSTKIDMKIIKHISVIAECLCRESCDITATQVTGSPTQAFGDDEYVKLAEQQSVTNYQKTKGA